MMHLFGAPGAGVLAAGASAGVDVRDRTSPPRLCEDVCKGIEAKAAAEGVEPLR
jgi:hypothetical protein